ncbi:MAG: bifunctional riboflavin kinase/FAD synthetase [Acidimicrobiales bacterium]
MEVITEGGGEGHRSGTEQPGAGTALTIGAFDGVHTGHRAVIDAVRELAGTRGLVPTVVTFDRHPATVVRPDSAPRLLTDLDQRLELLAAAGVLLTYVVTFDLARSTESARDFVSRVLVGELGARAVVVGADFHFGHRRQGNVALLEAMGAESGFEVMGLELLGAGQDDPVSSTRIRTLLAAGEVEGAASLLGRLHEVRGPVVRGDRRGGALLGCPTANVKVPDDVALPADGIYAGWYLRPDGSRHASAISVGRRPTFYSQAQPLVEAHLIDFDGNLYREPARVRFAVRLREERRFETTEGLVAQMRADVSEARVLLGASSDVGGHGG